MRKLSIVLSVQPAGFQAATFTGSLDTNLARIAALGYDGVELAIRDPALVDLEDLQAQVARHGLRVPAIGTGQAWGEEGLSFTDPSHQVRAAAIRRIESHILPARRFEAVVIIGLIRGVVRPGVDQRTAWQWMLDALRECCAAAASEGVRLAVEPINRYETSLINTAGQGLDLLRELGAKNLGLLLDTFHMNLEEPVIEAGIRACGPHIFHFHVADSNRRYPGAGHLDFESILGALAGTGYPGWVSGEFLPEPDAVTAAQRSIRLLKRIRPDSGRLTKKK